MGVARVHHVFNSAELKKLLLSPAGGVARDLIRRGVRVESAAKRNISTNPKRVNTGRLRSSITHHLMYDGRSLSVRVGTNVKYARYVHEGTGLYGPRRAFIRPKTARVLRWTSRGKTVYARYSSGMEKNEFLKNALSAARG